MEDRPNYIDGICIDDLAASAPTVNHGPNRKARRASLAQGKRLRKKFAGYQAHMKQHGYDTTFDDFVQSIP